MEINSATLNTEAVETILPDVMSNNNAYNVAKLLNTGSLSQDNLEPVMTENSAYNVGDIKNGSLNHKNVDDPIQMEPGLVTENSAYNVRENGQYGRNVCDLFRAEPDIMTENCACNSTQILDSASLNYDYNISDPLQMMPDVITKGSASDVVNDDGM